MAGNGSGDGLDVVQAWLRQLPAMVSFCQLLPPLPKQSGLPGMLTWRLLQLSPETALLMLQSRLALVKGDLTHAHPVIGDLQQRVTK